MDAGDVELSGAVDFEPNEVDDKPKTQEDQGAENTVETAKQIASVKEEDVRFRSDNIRKNEDMFVRVEGRERRKRAEERRKKYEQKQSLREAEMSDRVEKNRASKAVVESEKQLKKEQRRLLKEQREQENCVRRAHLFAWIKKHWYVFVIMAIVAVACLVMIGIINSVVSERAKIDAAIQEEANFLDDAKEIEKRMWENEDGQQPWTAIKEYDEMIAKLSTSELKADAYITRSRMLLNYVDMYNDTDYKDEIIRQAKSDVEKAAGYNVSDRAVCWASKMGKMLGDLEFYEKYDKECEEWNAKNPQLAEPEETPDNYEGGGEG